jgi:hypothetical protein
MGTGNDKSENELTEMTSDYLWDGSGEADPEVRRLEGLLSTFRHTAPAPQFPETQRTRWKMWRWNASLVPAMAAAAAVLVVGAVVFLSYSRKTGTVAASGWDVLRIVGTLRVGSNALSANTGAGELGVGQMLETGGESKATLRAEDVGQIEVDPNTRLRLLSNGTGLKRIALDRGTIHTYIWAPAGEFVVDTPSAMTVDLGCAYTLHVDDSGAGTVQTSRGWVGFKKNGRESFIPAGAACATHPKFGPGTPYFEDASENLRAALARFDFEDTTLESRARDLAIVLKESRKRDALTVWHLLSRVEADQRQLVYDRLQSLVPAPRGVSEEGVLKLDQPMLDLWWNRLGFDDIAVWRHWERSWSGTPAPTQ